jgi:hypothetical protein
MWILTGLAVLATLTALVARAATHAERRPVRARRYFR